MPGVSLILHIDYVHIHHVTKQQYTYLTIQPGQGGVLAVLHKVDGGCRLLSAHQHSYL